jgi:hypothetical protein
VSESEKREEMLNVRLFEKSDDALSLGVPPNQSESPAGPDLPTPAVSVIGSVGVKRTDFWTAAERAVPGDRNGIADGCG